jgi:23S rRNA (uracil1939-C5)-methyltransferase
VENSELVVTGVAAGGDGVGRLADGRAVFVRGALPGERVRVRLTEEKPRFARAEAIDVLEPAPGRLAPPCPLVAAGCGGCGWQHVDHATQRALKATIVTDALTRIGRLGDLPAIDPGPDLPATAFRTTVRAAVDADGVASLRVHHGHDVVALDRDGCLVAHPRVDDLLRRGRWHGATEVTVRAGVATGERLALVDPTASGADLPDDDVIVVGADELSAGKRAWYHEEVAGRRWRISADSFFQARPDGATALAELVAAAVGPDAATVVDLYAGVGLLGGVVLARRPEAHVQLVEANRSSVADAVENVPGAKVIRSDVRRWRPSAADVVIADPSRHGLGADVVDRIAATGAGTVVLVSCDPGALGRDAGLLAAAGLRLDATTLIDLFPHTPHVEVLTTWRR